jgi:hypothetical protein
MSPLEATYLSSHQPSRLSGDQLHPAGPHSISPSNSATGFQLQVDPIGAGLAIVQAGNTGLNFREYTVRNPTSNFLCRIFSDNTYVIFELNGNIADRGRVEMVQTLDDNPLFAFRFVSTDPVHWNDRRRAGRGSPVPSLLRRRSRWATVFEFIG